MFDADKPIENSSEDRLGRATFAKYLARCLLDHQSPESLVVGLYGGWGVGKTSIINLVLEELLFAGTNLEDEEKPILLNFNAWRYSGQDQLVYSFFRRLSATMRSVTYLENTERIVYLLELYVSFFTHQPIPKPLQHRTGFWQKLFSKHKNNQQALAWESGRDLTLVKAELNQLLSHQKHKIIIIIDNISQLEPKEMKQIFQIVKSIGDFANTVFLLALDKQKVIRALHQLDGSDGEEYIEKMIQLPFEVPPIAHYELEKILVDRLTDIVKNLPEGSWNTESWADIYYGSLKYFFQNCRDITRYINTVGFGYSRLKDVVNPVDYFAVTALEVFSPEVYMGIRENKDLFTDLADHVYFMNKTQMQKDKMRCDEILHREKNISPGILLDCIKQLFPRIRQIYQPETLIYHSEIIARKLRRICSPDMFEIYFRLSMQMGQIPDSEFQTILSMANNPNIFDQAITRLNQDENQEERIIQFLDKLDSQVILAIPKENIKAIVYSLLDNGDLFPQGKAGYFSLDTPMRIHRIMHALLRQLNEPAERFNVLAEAIKNAEKSLYIIIHELQEQGKEHLEDSDTFQPLSHRDILPVHLESLKKLAVGKIEEWADHDSLVDHPRLLSLLNAWCEWGDEEKCQQYVKKLTDTDRGMIAFLIALLNPAIDEAMHAYHKNAAWEKYVEDIQVFISPKALVDHAKLLFEDEYFEKLREKEQLALLIFLDLMQVPTNKVIRQTSV